MTKIVSSFNNLIGRILKKFYSLTFSQKIILVYLSFCVPFVYFHENHLPLEIISLLVGLAILVGGGLCYGSIHLSRFVFGKSEYTFIWQNGFILFGLVFLYLLGLLSNRAGLLFLFFIAVLYTAFRYLQQIVLYRIILFGLLILLNGLFTFKVLQMGEMLLFHWSQLGKYSTEGPNLEEWKWEEEKRKISHSSIQFEAKLPEGFFFHNAKDLKMDIKTGAGKLLGVISSSADDPNTYPYLKIFYLPVTVRVDGTALVDEYQSFLDFELNRGEIESLQNIGKQSFAPQNWEGNFWIFYDYLRPRNAKSGFYILPQKDGSHLLLAIRETLLENAPHEKEIQEILESIRWNSR